MLKKKIKYVDYNGESREEEYFFNMSESELSEWQYSVKGTLSSKIKDAIDTQNEPEIMKIYKDLILRSYGEKSSDGKRFRKKDDNGVPLANAFYETEAFSSLFTELLSDEQKANEFVEGVLPKNISSK